MAISSHPQDLSTLTQEIADELVLSRPVDDLVLKICEQTGWDWERAEKFVFEIEARVRKRKQARSKIGLLLAGFTSILGGLVVFAYTGYLGFMLMRSSLIHAGDWLSYYFFFDFITNGAPFFIAGMFFGLGMMAGGAYGIGKVISQ